jgi:uncharacterized damage-inducible protein DinB
MATDLRYPLGDFAAVPDTPEVNAAAVAAIEELPSRLRAAVTGLSEAQLDTRYRPGGWTVRQVVHHVADSHINGFVRTKLALTESNPTIKPYAEAEWAKLPDSRLPIEVSLSLIEAVHVRWSTLFRSLSPEQLQRTFVHPEHGRVMTLAHQLQDYSWHGRHHVAHITALRQRERW